MESIHPVLYGHDHGAVFSTKIISCNFYQLSSVSYTFRRCHLRNSILDDVLHSLQCRISCAANSQCSPFIFQTGRSLETGGLWQMSGASWSRQFPYPSKRIDPVRFNPILSSHEWQALLGSCVTTFENGSRRFASGIRSNEHVARDTRVTSYHLCFVFHREEQSAVFPLVYQILCDVH